MPEAPYRQFSLQLFERQVADSDVADAPHTIPDAKPIAISAEEWAMVAELLKTQPERFRDEADLGMWWTSMILVYHDHEGLKLVCVCSSGCNSIFVWVWQSLSRRLRHHLARQQKPTPTTKARQLVMIW